MRHFRAEEESNESQHQSKIGFKKTLTNCLENTLKLLPFAEFSVNYGKSYLMKDMQFKMFGSQ
jgi:hypothetical protein